ncbi:MAG: ABC transporter substrate-binding protein [Dehalococcoidia bacterium]
MKLGGKLTYPTPSEPPDLDPRLTLSYGLHNFLGSIHNRLIRTVQGAEAKDSNDFTLKGDLADKWEQPDPASLTFHLNQGVTWHNKPPVNGRELTSQDIKNTFESYAKSGAHTGAFDLLDHVEIPDKYTAKFVLKQGFGGMLEVLTSPTQWVFAQEIVDKEGDLKNTTVGTGPFVMDSFERKVGFKASKNPNYFIKGQPYLDAFEQPFIPDGSARIAGFRSGQFDSLTGLTPSDVDPIVKSNPDTQVQEIAAIHSVFGIAVAANKPPYNDPRVRQAISMAVDRNAQLQSIFTGHATYGWGIPWIYFQDAPVTLDQLGPYWKFDPTEAKKLLAAAGKPDGFKDTLMYFEYSTAMTSQVQLAQADLKKNLNIDLTIRQLDYPTWFQEYTSHKWTGTAWGFQIGSSSTLDDFTFQNIQSKSVANYWYVDDPQIDDLAAKIRAETDNTKKRDLAKQMFQRELDQAWRLWMPYTNAFYVLKPYVRNFRGMSLRGAGTADYGGAARVQHWIDKA